MSWLHKRNWFNFWSRRHLFTQFVHINLFTIFGWTSTQKLSKRTICSFISDHSAGNLYNFVSTTDAKQYFLLYEQFFFLKIYMQHTFFRNIKHWFNKSQIGASFFIFTSALWILLILLEENFDLLMFVSTDRVICFCNVV